MELVEVLNNRREYLNIIKDKRTLVDGEYRLASFIWIINDNDEILIQQRSANQPLPNMWGATAGGVKVKENSLDAAIREVKEELGIDATKNDFVFLGSSIISRMIIEIWLLKKNILINNLVFCDGEVQNALWVTIEEYENMVKQKSASKTSFDVFKNYYNGIYKKR